MKAKEYVAKYRDISGAEDIIVRALFQDAEDLAKIRNCRGGKTYADCFKEQWIKWIAICKMDSRYTLKRFKEMLEQEHGAVYKLIAKEMLDPPCRVAFKLPNHPQAIAPYQEL